MFFKTLDQSAFKSHITYLETGRRVNDKIQNAIKLKRENVLNPGCNCSLAQLCPTLCNPMDCSPPGSSVHGDPPSQNGMGCHFLHQGIFPTQGLNLGFLHCRRILYRLGHQGSPRILEWVAYPFSRGPSRPRNQTRVSHIKVDSTS